MKKYYCKVASITEKNSNYDLMEMQNHFEFAVPPEIN